MKKYLILFSFILNFNSTSFAQETDIPNIEFGVLLGEPLGISAKWWYTQRTGADIAVAWSFTENGVFEVHADYLLHPLLRELEKGTLPVYIGLGPALRIGDNWFLGARLPVGIQYLFSVVPLSIFGEIAPQWQLIPDLKFVLSGGVGIRIALGRVQ